MVYGERGKHKLRNTGGFQNKDVILNKVVIVLINICILELCSHIIMEGIPIQFLLVDNSTSFFYRKLY